MLTVFLILDDKKDWSQITGQETSEQPISWEVLGFVSHIMANKGDMDRSYREQTVGLKWCTVEDKHFITEYCIVHVQHWGRRSSYLNSVCMLVLRVGHWMKPIKHLKKFNLIFERFFFITHSYWYAISLLKWQHSLLWYAMMLELRERDIWAFLSAQTPYISYCWVLSYVLFLF